MTEVQLVNMLRKVKKIVDETEIYNKRLILLKEAGIPSNLANSILEDDEDLLFPLEIGNEMYLKAYKVYQEHKAYIEGIEKTINKYVDRLNKNERSSALMKTIANGSHNSNSNGNNNQSSNSSSSDDDDTDKIDKRSLKRKTKEIVSTPSSKTNKRIKQPSESPKNESSNESSTVSTPAKPVEVPTPSKAEKSSSSGSESPGQIPLGTQVAAKEKTNNWILAKVGSYNTKTQKYEVIDEDEDESKKFHVSFKDIIQLPSPNSLPPTFATNTKVLAMFPDTTTFYPAVVVSSQKVKNKTSFYTLHFDDDQGDNGQTPSRKVAAQHVVIFSK